MKTMRTLFAIAALAGASFATGCNKDKDKATAGETKPVEAKPVEAKPGEAKPAEAKPAEAKPDDKTTPAAAGDLPAECADYKAAIAKLASCDKLPKEQRDALQKAFDATSASWANVPAEGKAAVAQACKQAADGLKQTATACP